MIASLYVFGSFFGLIKCLDGLISDFASVKEVVMRRFF